jgi:hypothetical protein
MIKIQNNLKDDDDCYEAELPSFTSYHPYAAELPHLSYQRRTMELLELKRKLNDDFPNEDPYSKRFRILEFTIQFRSFRDRMIYTLKYL